MRMQVLLIVPRICADKFVVATIKC